MATEANMAALNSSNDLVNASGIPGLITEAPPVPQVCLIYPFIVSTIITGSLCVFGVIGNVLAFIVFHQDKIKTSTSFLFQGLSFIDTVLLVTAFPIYVVEPFVAYTGLFKSYFLIHPYILVYLLPFAFISQTATIWVTVLVGVNRYIAVCKPYQAVRLCTVVQARRQLAVVIIFAILYNTSRFFEAKMVYFPGPNNETIAEPSYTALGHSQLYHVIYSNILYMIFLLALPSLILTVLNIRLINALKELKRRRAEMQSLRQQQDNNVTLVLIVVIIVFTVCQAPALVNQIFWNALPNEDRHCQGFQWYFSRISNVLVLMNSAVNFVIYFFFNTRFRQVLMQTVCKREYQKIQTSSSTVNHTTQTTLNGNDKANQSQSLL